MVYVTRHTREGAEALVKELIQEGYTAYFLESHQDNFEVRYWR